MYVRTKTEGLRLTVDQWLMIVGVPFFKILTKNRILFILVQKWKGEENGYFMDRQYEHVFIGDSDHYGFLPYHAGECGDTVAKKRIEC